MCVCDDGLALVNHSLSHRCVMRRQYAVLYENHYTIIFILRLTYKFSLSITFSRCMCCFLFVSFCLRCIQLHADNTQHIHSHASKQFKCRSIFYQFIAVERRRLSFEPKKKKLTKNQKHSAELQSACLASSIKQKRIHCVVSSLFKIDIQITKMKIFQLGT